MRTILIIGQADPEAAATLAGCFEDHDTRQASTLDEAVATAPATGEVCEYAFIDIGQLEVDDAPSPWREGLRRLWQVCPEAHVVVMGAPEGIRSLVRAVKSGAGDYLTYPIVAAEVGLIRKYFIETERVQGELDYLRARVWPDDKLHTASEPASPAMGRVLAQIRRAAETDTTVLLTGETGTGKTLLARMVHQLSGRSHRQFIAVHCGAIPESLLESELFGHERGAFTGAVRRKLGKFELADGGTLFLDEVGTMSSAMQIKLLQVLQERTFERVGGEETLAVDVRVVAATNLDLRAASESGSFRSDLYFRLNVFPVALPALRDRREDIPALVETFVARANRQHGSRVRSVHPVVVDALTHYDWPGNVRELESIIERACILETDAVLGPDSLPAELFDALPRPAAAAPVFIDPLEPLATVRKRAVERVETHYLAEQLRRHEGRIAATAEACGITVRQLHKLMTRHGLRKEDYRPERGASTGTPRSDPGT